MKFQQPNSRTRVMSQVVDRLISGAKVTLSFQTESEALQGLNALHDVASVRQAGIVVEPLAPGTFEVRLVRAQAT